MLKDKKICIFCSSSNNIDKIYFKTARSLATLLAKEMTDLVFGGGMIGLMGVLAKVYKKERRIVIGVVPEKLNKKGIIFEETDRLIVTRDMHERKQFMFKESNAFIALPGGFGTLDELLEIITLKQLGFHDKPIAVLNINNFYDFLLKQLEVLHNNNFTRKNDAELFYVDSNPANIVNFLNNNIKN